MIGKTTIKTLAVAAAFVVATGTAAAQPNPVLYLTGTEYFTTNGQNFVRYRYDVLIRIGVRNNPILDASTEWKDGEQFVEDLRELLQKERSRETHWLRRLVVRYFQ